MPECRKCRTELTEENWYASERKENNRICKECDSTRAKEWRKAHPEKAKIYRTRTSRKAELVVQYGSHLMMWDQRDALIEADNKRLKELTGGDEGCGLL